MKGWLATLYLRIRDRRNAVRLARIESKVYPNKRAVRIKWETRLAPLVLLACLVAYDNVPEYVEIFLLWPLIWYAFEGAMSKEDQAISYKVGWLAGRADLGASLVKHVEVNEDGEFVGIHAALEEAHERSVFALEELGLSKPPPVEVDDDDDA